MLECLLHRSDCLETMRTLPDNSIDACVTDPPYGISFMHRKWDYDVPSIDVWQEVLRILKPGAHILVACGTRTQHRMAINIEDAGFEIRDVITWLYGSGFPKSMDVSKAMDEAVGAVREDAIKGGHMAVAGRAHGLDSINDAGSTYEHSIPAVINKGDWSRGTPITPEAKQWQGWGTALKPACEFWTLAHKPLAENTIASNIQTWGTGGINVNACRIATNEECRRNAAGGDNGLLGTNTFKIHARHVEDTQPQTGRFPANLILDEEVAALLDEQSAVCASRFFYCPKASKKEKDAGLENLSDDYTPRIGDGIGVASSAGGQRKIAQKNGHPTIKPIALMRYLCRLITPPNGIVLDPYMGSGSTGIAACLEGFNFIGIELSQDYFEIAKQRIEFWAQNNEHPL